MIIATAATAVSVPVLVPWPLFAQTQTEEAQVEGIARQRAAAGWLRLESDQRESRQRAGPATPAESDRRQALEWEEAIRYRELLQQQDRDIQSWRRQDRLIPQTGAGLAPATPTGRANLQGRLMQLDAAQQSQRLRMQMDRDRRSQTTPSRRSGLR